MASTTQFTLEASVRHNMGKGASRRLRREEKVPGVIYGGGKNAISLTMEHKVIAKALSNEAFYSHILTLKVGPETERVILKDVQRHPFKPRITHVDFLRIRADEKLHMHVPLHFVNGEKAPGAKEGGLISHIMTDVEVACLPANLPEFIEIDLSKLALNQTLHLSDIKLPNGVEIVALTHGHDQAVASVHMPRAEEEIPSEAPVAAEVPAIEQKGDEEGKSE